MSRSVRMELHGEAVRSWEMQGFPEETVLVVPVGDQLLEVAVRVMDRPCHTQPADEPRAATLDEVVEVCWLVAEKARTGGAL